MKGITRFAGLFLLSAVVSAQGLQGWIFNDFLAMLFFGDPAIYAVFVASGSPCYAWHGGGAPDSPQPFCFYDPSNLNPGYVAAQPALSGNLALMRR